MRRKSLLKKGFWWGVFLLWVVAAQAVSQTFKAPAPLNPPSKDLQAVSPPTPAVKERKLPAKPRGATSDLSLERIYVKGCQVHVTVVNRGKAGLSLRDYNNGRLSLTLQWQTGTSAGLEPRVFTLKQVDPKGALGRPGGWVEFNTRVWVKYPNFTIRAKLEGLKDDRGKGKKELRQVLSVAKRCIGTAVRSPAGKETYPQGKGMKGLSLTPLPGRASDLSIERIYLKGCTVHVVIKNRGKKGLTERGYEQGKLVVELKGKAIIGVKTPLKGAKPVRYVFSLKQVDPKGVLKKSGGVVDFDTKIKCSEKARAEVHLEGVDKGKIEKRLIATLTPPESCVKKGFPKKEALRLLALKKEQIAKPSRQPHKAPPSMKKGVFPVAPGGLPEDLSGFEFRSPSSRPRALEPPQPEGAIEASLLFEGQSSASQEYGVQLDFPRWFLISWDEERLRVAGQQMGDMELEKVTTRMVFVDGNTRSTIYDLEREGDYSPYDFRSDEVLNKLQRDGFFRWDKLEYHFIIEGEATYRDSSGREETRPLNRISVAWHIIDTEGHGSLPLYGAPILRPRVSIEDIETIWQGAGPARAPYQRQVQLRVSVRNAGEKSTDQSLTDRGADAVAQGVTDGAFWVSVYRVAGPGGDVYDQQIASFLVGPLGPGEEWESPPITDTSPAYLPVHYRVVADALDFIREEVETLNEAWSEYYPEYWKWLKQNGEADVRVVSVRTDPAQFREGQGVNLILEVENQSSLTIPVRFIVRQENSSSGDDIPRMLAPGRQTVRLWLEDFRPPTGTIGLEIFAKMVYWIPDQGFVHHLCGGNWDRVIKTFHEISSGLYSLTDVPIFISIRLPRAGSHYRSKTFPPDIWWEAHDPTDNIQGNVEIYYSIKEGNTWSEWRLIDTVPASRSSYPWRPTLTVGERDTKVLVRWIRPDLQEPLEDESGVFTVDFQSDYSAYGIELTAPRANDTWPSGQTAVVSWRVDPQRYKRIAYINLYRVDDSGSPTGDWWRLANDIEIDSDTDSVQVNVPRVSGNFRVELRLEWDYYAEPPSQRPGRTAELWSEIFRIE